MAEPSAKKMKMTKTPKRASVSSSRKVAQQSGGKQLDLRTLATMLMKPLKGKPTKKLEGEVLLHAILHWAGSTTYQDWMDAMNKNPKVASDLIRDNYWRLLSKEDAFARFYGKAYDPSDAGMAKDMRNFMIDVRKKIEALFTSDVKKPNLAALFGKLCVARGAGDVKKALGLKITKLIEIAVTADCVWVQRLILPRGYETQFPGANYDEVEVEVTPVTVPTKVSDKDQSVDAGIQKKVEFMSKLQLAGMKPTTAKPPVTIEMVFRLLPQGQQELKKKRHTAQELKAELDEYRRKSLPVEKQLKDLTHDIETSEQGDEQISYEHLLNIWRQLFDNTPEGSRQFKEALAANIFMRKRLITPADFWKSAFGVLLEEDIVATSNVVAITKITNEVDPTTKVTTVELVDTAPAPNKMDTENIENVAPGPTHICNGAEDEGQGRQPEGNLIFEGYTFMGNGEIVGEVVRE